MKYYYYYYTAIKVFNSDCASSWSWFFYIYEMHGENNIKYSEFTSHRTQNISVTKICHGENINTRKFSCTVSVSTTLVNYLRMQFKFSFSDNFLQSKLFYVTAPLSFSVQTVPCRHHNRPVTRHDI
jgi:hypothetical protein